MRPGDILIAVGGASVGSLAELYRGMWRLGDPGVKVPLRILRDSRVIELERALDRSNALAAAEPDLLTAPGPPLT